MVQGTAKCIIMALDCGHMLQPFYLILPIMSDRREEVYQCVG